jgi:hypothetical protein
VGGNEKTTVNLFEMAKSIVVTPNKREEAVSELAAKIFANEEAVRQCVMEICKRMLSDDAMSENRRSVFRVTSPTGTMQFVIEHTFGVGALTRALADVASQHGYRADPVDPLPALKELLASNGPGRVAEVVRKGVEACLAAVWERFTGHEITAMCGEKLLGRMEKIRWEPSLLHFVIERHGAIVGRGSPRAELQYWTADLDALKAGVEKTGRRQVYPPRPRKK